MFESKELNCVDSLYLDVFGRARTKSLIVATNTSYILLANIAIPTVGIGLRRVFSCHFLIVRKVKEFSCLSNGKLRLQQEEIEQYSPI